MQSSTSSPSGDGSDAAVSSRDETMACSVGYLGGSPDVVFKHLFFVSMLKGSKYRCRKVISSSVLGPEQFLRLHSLAAGLPLIALD